jgi:hypothetical protein
VPLKEVEHDTLAPATEDHNKTYNKTSSFIQRMLMGEKLGVVKKDEAFKRHTIDNINSVEVLIPPNLKSNTTFT